MKLTKYEYKHNRFGNRKVYRLGAYFPPVARIFMIVIVNIVTILTIFDIVYSKNIPLINNIICLLLIIIFSFLVIEYNPLFIFSIIIRGICYIFSKNNHQKKLIYSLLRDYNNIINFEKKMGITDVNISFFNPFKIYFKKNGKKGSITIKIIKCGKTTEKNQMTDYKKYNDYIFYLKTEIIKVYKEDTTLNN